MRTRSFKYVGDSKALLVGSNRLEKGKVFETDDLALADYIATMVDVEEVKETAKSSSKKNDAGES